MTRILFAVSLAALAACSAPRSRSSGTSALGSLDTGSLEPGSLEPLPVAIAEAPAVASGITNEIDTTSEPVSDLQTGPRRNTATAESSNGLFSAYLGGRKMRDGSLWTSLRDQFAFGLEWMMKRPRNKLGLAVGTQLAYKRESAFSGTIDVWAIEGYLGPKLYINLGRSPFDVYASAGPTLLYYDAEAYIAGVGSRRSSDTSFAGYATLGAMFNVNRRQAIGVEFRTVQFADSNFFGFDGNSNYDQLAFVFSSYL